MAVHHTPDANAIGGHFLNAQRLTVYPFIFLVVYVVAAAYWVSESTGLIDPKDKPLGYDFIAFWSGATLALDGNPADVFDPAKLFAVQQVAVPGNEMIFLWHYPPTFLMMVLPLAVLPYIWSYLVWVFGTLVAYASTIRKMAPQPQTVMLVLAFPASFINLMHGQNAFLTAALFGGAMLTLERRPILAGILIGMMSYKPHLGLLIPIALVCGGHWRAFAAAAATTIALALLSVAILGAAPWMAFFENISLVHTVLEKQLISWSKIPSLYATLRLLGLGGGPAYALQILLALGVVAAVAIVWRQKSPLPLRAAVLVAGSLLISPYMFSYDLALLAIPIALLAMDGYVRGWLSGEREILALCWLMPLGAVSIAEAIGLQLGAFCLIALFAIAFRRARATDDLFKRL